MAESLPVGAADTARERSFRWLAPLWLGCVSASLALVVTVALFDRTTLSGISRLWLACLVLCFAVAYAWWLSPSVRCRRIQLGRYELISLLRGTMPVALASIVLTVAIYQSDGLHGYFYHNFYYERLLTKSYWPVIQFSLGLYLCVLLWVLRSVLLDMGSGDGFSVAMHATVRRLPRALPLGLLAIGLLLSTVSLSMITINYWRYWATADGLLSTGHYTVTFSDQFQVQMGGLTPYFVNLPLPPIVLMATFGLLGHDTLALHLPIIIGSALLPLSLYLAIRELTRSSVLAFLFACLVSAFPLLRSYTLDFGEADSLFLTALVFATYFRLRAARIDASRREALVSGVSAGIAALTRPEGIIYTGAMFFTGLKDGWRRRGFWLSVLAWAVLLAALSAVTIRDLGEIWPSTHSGIIKLSNFGDTLQVVQGAGLYSRYANALGMSEGALTAIVVIVLALIGLSSLQMLRKDFALVFLPATALGNVVMVFFSGPIPAEATKFHDFFRHISYGFPLLGITLAYWTGQALNSLHWSWRRVATAFLSAALALLVLAELLVLEAPVRPFDTVRNSLMTSDVHVTAATLLTDPYPLETMRFRREGSLYVVDGTDEYLAALPDNLSRHYAPADVRQYDNPADYYAAAGMLFFGFLALAAAPALLSLPFGSVQMGATSLGRWSRD